MTQHTPGPWRYNPDFDEIQSDSGLGLPILAKIKRGGGDWPEDEEADANARLMSSAPELLRLLQSILDWQPITGTLEHVTIDWLTHQQIRKTLACVMAEEQA